MKTIFKQPFSTPLKRFLMLSIFCILSLQSIAGPIITLTIELGRRSKGCTGLSICKFKLELEDRLSSATLQASTKELIMNIKSEALIGHENAIQNGYFIMEEDYVVPDDVAKALGESPKIVLKTGKYLARKTTTGYTIRFPIE
jgi:hypothetical protein